MKKQLLFLITILFCVAFVGCETVNDNGQPIISYGEAFAAQWRYDFWYAFLSILFFVLLVGYCYYITKYKDWEVGTIIGGMILLMCFAGITFGKPNTTHLNTTREAVEKRGNYTL